MQRIVAGLAITWVLLAASQASAQQAETRTFELQHLRVQHAATVLRSIVGIRLLEVADERTIAITGEPDAALLSTELMTALDTATVVLSRQFTTGDETAVAVIPLRDMSAREAMETLRELQLQRVTAHDGPAVVVVRDTPDRVSSAIAALDQPSDG